MPGSLGLDVFPVRSSKVRLMDDHAAAAQLFLDLHHGARPLLLPNPWDVGSAKLLASMGFQALATTSAGHAATLGRLDGAVTRD
jgi:2-methylisocitrate lyase-like PEP mutase family enzyme